MVDHHNLMVRGEKRRPEPERELTILLGLSALRAQRLLFMQPYVVAKRSLESSARASEPYPPTSF